MSYYFSTILDTDFNTAIDKVTEELISHGFGILTEINVKETLKKKLDVDFREYKILGACNPPFAYKALTAENKIGVMLPCNVIVQTLDDCRIEVSAVDPIASMQAVKNPALGDIAHQVTMLLKKIIENL
jgi:uncharacterized protein (DUF302 family)